MYNKVVAALVERNTENINIKYHENIFKLYMNSQQ